jgi:hypothetical protein
MSTPGRNLISLLLKKIEAFQPPGQKDLRNDLRDRPQFADHFSLLDLASVMARSLTSAVSAGPYAFFRPQPAEKERGNGRRLIRPNGPRSAPPLPVLAKLL